jgi:hypothetical protein
VASAANLHLCYQQLPLFLLPQLFCFQAFALLPGGVGYPCFISNFAQCPPRAIRAFHPPHSKVLAKAQFATHFFSTHCKLPGVGTPLRIPISNAKNSTSPKEATPLAFNDHGTLATLRGHGFSPVPHQSLLFASLLWRC